MVRCSVLRCKSDSELKYPNLSFHTHLYIQTNSISQHQMGQDKDAFHSVMGDVVESVVAHPAITEIPNLDNWIKKLFTHNLTGGKAARGQSVVMAYETLEKPEKLTVESLKLARVLGWCVEMFQSYVVIMDDMMDASSTRRGQPCWYLIPGVGTACAMNDSILVHNGMFYVMMKYFSKRKNYADMLDTINEAMFCTGFGQFLDLKTSEVKNKDYRTTFTPERHLAIIKYKTAFYTYDLPIYLGFLLTENKLDGNTRKKIKDLSLELGTLFQIQDDYIDCFGDEALTGKAGTDIQEGKCSWLAVNALQRCSEAQRVVFNACYGSKEPAHVERIKRLYEVLKLPELYKQVEGKYYDDILENIRNLPTDQWKMLFNKILGITYQRKK